MTAAILALVITLSLCACGATGNTGAASAGNKPKKIEKPVADTLDGILEAIEDDYKTTVQAFRDSLDTINAVIGGDYTTYGKNRQMISPSTAVLPAEAPLSAAVFSGPAVFPSARPSARSCVSNG